MAYLGAGLDAVNETLSTINMVCDTMTGNGVLTTKVLGSPTAPGSVNNVSVYYDGVAQTPTTDYTLSGSTITFTTAPENNVNVVILSYADEFSKTISDNTVYTDVIEDSAITNNKILGISASKLTGALPALDGSALTGIVTLDPVLINETSNPTVSSMLATGNGVGTIWVNSTTGAMFICTDATVGANIWLNVGEGSGSLVPIQYMSATNTNGTEVTDPSDANYKVVTFNTSGSFTPTIGVNATYGNKVDYLVIAGGGGGSNYYYSGGGGAGGYLSGTVSLSSGAITVTVGAGGARKVGAGTGNSGVDSSFGAVVIADGGGYGGSSFGGDGGSSGGGSASGNGVGGAATAGQGNVGANGSTYSGGGGGGAGGGGLQATSGATQSGGPGAASSITGTSVTRAGGGGGAMDANYTYFLGLGGSGGGGNAGGAHLGPVVSPIDGSVNTGSGGGGGCFPTNAYGAAGGSGVVIVRYRFQ